MCASKALLPVAPIVTIIVSVGVGVVGVVVVVGRATVAHRECMGRWPAVGDNRARQDRRAETIHRDRLEFAAIKRRAPRRVAELISRRRGSATERARCRLSAAAAAAGVHARLFRRRIAPRVVERSPDRARSVGVAAPKQLCEGLFAGRRSLESVGGPGRAERVDLVFCRLHRRPSRQPAALGGRVRRR